MTKKQAQIKELSDRVTEQDTTIMLLREKLHRIIEDVENALRTARDL